MRLLLDECLPRKLKFLLSVTPHTCKTAADEGLSGKENGELLDAAEQQFEVLITIDKNIRHQQNISGRRIAVVIIRAQSNDISDIQPHIDGVLTALRSIRPGQIIEVGLPR